MRRRPLLWAWPALKPWAIPVSPAQDRPGGPLTDRQVDRAVGSDGAADAVDERVFG